MTVRAIAADGSTHVFPDNTPPEVVDRVMKAYAASKPPARASAAPATQSAPRAAPPRKQDAVSQITGLMANVNRGLGIGDELAAGGKTALNVLTGKTPIGDLVNGYKQSMTEQRAIEDGYSADHPNAAALARGTGMAGTALIPTGAALQGGRVMNAVRGATGAATGAAAYSLADRGSIPERIDAAKAAAVNPLGLALGSGAGAAMRPLPRLPRPATTPPQVLREAGVALTPGQSRGGIVKSAEDVAMRAPILGTAVRGARQRSRESLNRAVANRALAPIGETLPRGVATGHDSVAHVADRLGAVYDDAAALVPSVAPDQAFTQALGAIGQRTTELPTDVGTQFANIIQNRLTDRLQSGPVTGTQLRGIQSEIGHLAARRSASQDPAQQELGHMLEDVSGELSDLLGRANPEAGAMIGRANEGWAIYVRLRNAASKAKGGIATPGQFTTAVRMSDNSVGKGRVARGGALLQDLIDPASQVMPDAFGNPGTADALGLGALATSILTKPAVGIPTAAALSAGSVPYLLMGRGATGVPRAAGAIPARGLSPEVAARLARALGVAGSPRPVASSR